VKRPPLAVVLVAVLVIALGELGGALLSQLRPATARWAAARVMANSLAHGLTGSAEYDEDVRDRAVFAVEAGLSFFHTHAEGMGLVLFFASALVASLVRGRHARAALSTLLAAGALFPLGYLAYALAVLELGRDSGIQLAETWVLTPLGLAAVTGLLGLAISLARRENPRDATAPPEPPATDEHTWRLPPRGVLLAAVVLLVAAEVGGASMARFKVELARWARTEMLARPMVHGLVGVRDVDERALDEALFRLDAGLRLFHMHAEGMALVIIATTTTAATLARHPAVRRTLVLLLTVGGVGYPLGYLLWSALIPAYGVEQSKLIAEWVFWIPFGGATIVALLWLVALTGLRLARR
jgi:hypothetical protein